MLNKVKDGSNMYQDFITHTWPVGRGCATQCSYCYVKSIGGLADGQPKDFFMQAKPDLGKDKTIFVGNCIDLFGEHMDERDIIAVLRHCQKYPLNKYVFQTKNPQRMFDYLPEFPQAIPGQCTLGTTIETDNETLIAEHSQAPPVAKRAQWIAACKHAGFKTFVTLEPLMSFDLRKLTTLLATAQPNFINIGADSKQHQFPEPAPEQVQDLLATLRNMGFEVKVKQNLERLMR